MSKNIIIANWKMNPSTEKEAIRIAKASDLKDVIIAAPYVFLSIIKKVLKKASLAAQDVFWEKEGAYTGEISAMMLKNLGVKYVIIGHSERRASGDSDEIVNKKIKAALKYNLIPILCVGERERDEEMKYLSFIKEQLIGDLKSIPGSKLKNIIIAYEPVWAIGKNAKREATPEESLEMVIFIKKVLSDIYGMKAINGLRILYGGSVHPKNSKEFSINGGVSGFLVGRDSLDPKKFNEIIKAN
jgi:triosephosphate isomerase